MIQWTDAEIIGSGAAAAWEAYEKFPNRGHSKLDCFVAGFYAGIILRDSAASAQSHAQVRRAVDDNTRKVMGDDARTLFWNSDAGSQEELVASHLLRLLGDAG